MKLIYATYVLPYTYARAATLAGMTPIVICGISCLASLITGSEFASILAIVLTIFLMIAGACMLMIHLLRLRGPDRIGRFLKSAKVAILLLVLDLPIGFAAYGLQHFVSRRIHVAQKSQLIRSAAPSTAENDARIEHATHRRL